jgi:hypothetical protein
MSQGLLSVPEIAAAAGERMDEHHLHRLELAGMIEMQGEKIVLTEAGGGLQRAGEGAEGEGRGGQGLSKKNQTARGHPTLKGWGMLRAARFG